jgi:hypothetical protein
MSNLQAYLIMFGLCAASLWALLASASAGVRKSEKLKAAKEAQTQLKKQIEVANAQTKISDNAPTSRNDALKRLSQRSHSNR